MGNPLIAEPRCDGSHMKKVSILVLGAGPTGLGAATRLHQHQHTDWLLIDKAEEAGGLACTDVTREGFYFDMGGHVTFSHWEYFDQLLNAALGSGPEAWNTHQRVSYVWIKGRWVAYPFQNNVSALDKEDQVKCLSGLVDAKVAHATAKHPPKCFDEWIMRCMGQGIADLFMRPYNFKVWAVPTTAMQCEWLGERVATVDVSRAISNVVHSKEDAGWGPNAVFRFPKYGGTGAMWKGVARLLPRERQVYNQRVVLIDKDSKTVELASGETIQYDQLISTLPLDVTLRWLGKGEWAAGLQYSSSHIVGIGIRGRCPHGPKCWLYFPEDDCPFYRATVFSNYAEANCPAATTQLPTLCTGDGEEPRLENGRAGGASGGQGGPYWSLMFEISESSVKPVKQGPVQLAGQTWPEVVRETLAGAVNTRLVRPDDEIVSIYHRRLQHGYPTPSLGRDAVLNQALPWLREHDIWSRGRFGSYKYEVANQDHSLMLGVEAVNNILFGSAEMTLNHPNVVNATKNTELRYEPAMPMQ